MKTYSVWFEGNDGKITLQVSGLTKEQADKIAEMDTVLSIDELNGKYVVRDEGEGQ